MIGIIYEDLEIDTDLAITNPDAFSDQVYSAAEKLKDILRTNNSVDSYMRRLPKIDTTEQMKGLQKEMEFIYEYIDEKMDIQALQQAADELRKLAGQIEWLARDKATRAVAETDGGLDKASVHHQYTRLRENFNDYIKAIAIFQPEKEYTPLPPMPGNYAKVSGLIHYLFYFGDSSEGYRNHNQVCRKLNLDTMNLMDTVEYVESHPELNVTVKRVQN